MGTKLFKLFIYIQISRDLFYQTECQETGVKFLLFIAIGKHFIHQMR